MSVISLWTIIETKIPKEIEDTHLNWTELNKEYNLPNEITKGTSLTD